MKDYEAIADAIAREQLAKCYRTQEANRPLAERTLRDLMRVTKSKPQRIEWALSPPVGIQPAYWLQAETDRNWIAYYASAEAVDEPDEETLEQRMLMLKLIDECHLVAWCVDRIVMVEYPSDYFVDELGRPHRVGGPDLRYRDGACTHHWHGMRMPCADICHPERITLARIRNEKNQDRLRALMSLWPGGELRFLQESGAKPLDKSEYGELYLLNQNELVVIVSDGIQQLDGSNPRYMLRANRECRPMRERPDGTIEYGAPQKLTAKNAVAASYFMRGEEYDLAIRT